MEKNHENLNSQNHEKNKPYIGKKVDIFGNIYEGYLLNNKAEGHGINSLLNMYLNKNKLIN